MENERAEWELPEHPDAGIIRLRQALQVDDHPVQQGAGLILLARAAAESGQADLFDATTSRCVQALENASEQEVLFSPFTVREVRLRGLLATDRPAQAAELAGRYPADSVPPSPHWRVIERITAAEVLARSGDARTAETMLTAAISDAETLRLPHQVQRIIRLASEPGVLAGQTVHQQARAVLTRLDNQLASKAIQTLTVAGDTRACRATTGTARSGGGSPSSR